MKFVGLQLDIARQKETIQYIKSYIDFAKGNGYNTLFLYIEASIRTRSTYFFDPEKTYSEAEIKDIVGYANSIGIDVIPALENADHLENFFAYQQLEHISECVDAKKEGRGFDGDIRGTSGCVSNPEFYKVLNTYYKEVISLFTSKYVHVGMDEVFDFAICPRCKERLNNGETKKDLFFKHVMQTYDLVKSLGKRMMMWDDFFEYLDIIEDLPRDIIMCNWDYGYITDESGGKWINRKKKDWFYIYDKLGFEYIYCIYASRSSSTYNMDSFDRYAVKYNPSGALMTAWCRADSFYHGAYPYMAYAGRKWSGRATEKDKIKIYSEFLGSADVAELVLSVQGIQGVMYTDVATVCENFNGNSAYYLDNLRYVNKQLKQYSESAQEQQKEIILDIYGFLKEIEIDYRLWLLGNEIFDNYESRRSKGCEFLQELNMISAEYEDIYQNGRILWEKYRSGIKSFNNKFENKFNSKKKKIVKIRKDILKNKGVGVLYASLMLHDYYGTGCFEVKVKYKGSSRPTVYNCPSKVSGCSTLRFVIKNKPIDYMIFSVYGESALYPLNFRYTQNGKKYVASKVKKICGNVKDMENVLINDTQFAQMGYNDGDAHFEDISLSKKKSKIKVYFEEL